MQESGIERNALNLWWVKLRVEYQSAAHPQEICHAEHVFLDQAPDFPILTTVKDSYKRGAGYRFWVDKWEYDETMKGTHRSTSLPC